MSKVCAGCKLPMEILADFDECDVCGSRWCDDCVSKNPHLGKICKECGHNLGGKNGGISKEVWDLPWSDSPHKNPKDMGGVHDGR